MYRAPALRRRPCWGHRGRVLGEPASWGSVPSSAVVTALTEMLPMCAGGAAQELAITEYTLFILFCFPLAPN